MNLMTTQPALGHQAPTAWTPIATIPEDRRDGRDMMLWAGHLIVCSWCDGWCDPVGRPVRGATHYADVEGPGE